MIHSPPLKLCKMKLLLLPLLSGICILPVNSQFAHVEKPIVSTNILLNNGDENPNFEITFQDEPGYGRMRSIVFKSQKYCRADLDDFEFEARFSVLSATVYFSGANFKTVEKGFITSSSLKPIKGLMDRCIPGSIVTFDDVKVKGPDNLVRTIPGINLQLY